MKRPIRPYPPLLVRTARSSVLIWLLVRIVYALVLIVGAALFGVFSVDQAMQSALLPIPASRLLLVVVTAVLVQVDRTRAHEGLLQANFGVSAWWFTATSVFAAGLTDFAVQSLATRI